MSLMSERCDEVKVSLGDLTLISFTPSYLTTVLLSTGNSIITVRQKKYFNLVETVLLLRGNNISIAGNSIIVEKK